MLHSEPNQIIYFVVYELVMYVYLYVEDIVCVTVADGHLLILMTSVNV